MSFYINKIKKPTPAPPVPGPQPASITAPVQTAPEPPADDIKEAKSLVKESSMPTSMWKMFVLEIIEEHPETSTFIKDYLGS